MISRIAAHNALFVVKDTVHDVCLFSSCNARLNLLLSIPHEFHLVFGEYFHQYGCDKSQSLTVHLADKLNFFLLECNDLDPRVIVGILKTSKIARECKLP